ncbi:MAG: outer membrane protein OmpK [Shewanella sp.]|nr:outer membrane protein OmpK [Shewanella sp.]
MKNVKTLALATALTAGAMSAPTFAADRSDLHAGDYKWMQFNYMYALEELPRASGDASGHDYLEMEFGGRSGIFDLYGYVDVFNPSERDSSDKVGKPKMFMKFAPRISLDALTGIDLSFGPVKEVYFSTLFNWDGGYDAEGGSGTNNSNWGVGADVEVPWLGKTGMNLYAQYDLNAKEWNGYQFSANWFKPLHNFDNGSFVSFQGYVDWQFGAQIRGNDFVPKGATGGQTFLGLYWHSERYALGYGLKAYKNTYTITDGAGIVGLKSTGVSHYFSATYKF